MISVSRAFHEVDERRGLVLGILPGAVTKKGYHAPDGYPNPYIDLSIRTHLPLSGTRGSEPMSRNHINVLTPKLIVALPGGAGTASEVRLARSCRKPVIAYLGTSGSIAGLDLSDIPVARELEEVKTFVRSRAFGSDDTSQ